MTDEEPEPFRMPTDPDADEAAAEPDEPPTDDGAGQEAADSAESIADLIDEASRSAAEQATAQPDEPDEPPVRGTDAVWQQAKDDAASNVWDLDEDGGSMWDSAGAPIHEQGPSDEATTPWPEAAAGRPAAAEGMPDAGDAAEPDTFTFAVGEDGGTPPPAAQAPSAGTEPTDEPETFSFPAGPETTAPSALPDHREGEDGEPEAFSFPVAEGEPDRPAAADQGDASTSGADDSEEWTVPSADAADMDHADVDDDVWTLSVATDQDTPLAESASPRDDAGWHDLEAELEPAWAAPDLPVRADAGDDEASERFAAAVQAHDDEDDDAPWIAPALPDDDVTEEVAQDRPSDDVVTAEVQNALGDLLGNDEEDAVVETGRSATPPAATPPAATPPATTPSATPAAATAPEPADGVDDSGLDDFDHLDNLDDLEHLDDMAAAAVPAVGSDQPPADDDADSDDEVEVERPLDAPTAARQVMEPGSVTFSSSGKKKRGLFG